MREFLCLLVIVVAAALWWPQRKAALETSPASEALVTQESVPAAPRAQSAAPTPEATRTASPKREAVDPYTVDRFSLRKLDHPLPKSLAELQEKRTEYRKPTLPAVLPGQENEGDGDTLADFAGYYEHAPDDLRPVFIRQDTGGVRVAFGREKWQEVSKESFDDDPYSLVLTLPDGQMLYLKFRSQLSVPGVERSVRGMIGWLIRSGRAMPLAAMEEAPSLNAPSREQIAGVMPSPLK